MNEKEKLLRKIELKDSSGMDISGELAEASAMAIKEMKFDELQGERLHLLKERLDNDLKNLPATTSAIPRRTTGTVRFSRSTCRFAGWWARRDGGL